MLLIPHRKAPQTYHQRSLRIFVSPHENASHHNREHIAEGRAVHAFLETGRNPETVDCQKPNLPDTKIDTIWFNKEVDIPCR
jgi:hypothetical protein